MSYTPNTDGGFSLLELAFVLFIVGVLLATAFPLYISASAESRRSTCFENQRTIEAAAETWLTLDHAGDRSVLEGVVTRGHPLVSGGYLQKPPTCPAAPQDADPAEPTPAGGAYSLTESSTVVPCSFGSLTSHGRYE